MTAPRTRVVLVDDHPLVRTGIRALIDATGDLEVVAEAADGQAAVDAVSALSEQPDVVLMDLSMPGVDGVEATRRLVDGGATAAVVVLTSFADQTRVAEALEAGAVGYLLKDSEPAELLAGIRSAAAGHAPLDPRVARALLPTRTSSPGGDLSDREREVLALVAQGLANKQIASRLGIAERTVKVHLGSVFRRLGVADRTSAALWAREHL
ncbi:response regulator transcription factor [Nocardioides sp. CER19]|uniref:response regulator transcription factor n=1 Tax=Nocardioides sp. CER19 TaxID=3038538 RepID=UPI0024482207|nr:response regulator transcription factor [Nocardioides sp. CER19]MDH2416863.1 response regulator transcription factor [Nocardioides sp. CER19]